MIVTSKRKENETRAGRPSAARYHPRAPDTVWAGSTAASSGGGKRRADKGPRRPGRSSRIR
jgi:hypothetical protein